MTCSKTSPSSSLIGETEVEVDEWLEKEQCEKEKLKSQKKKEEGKVKLVKDMTPREVSLARKRWRENVAAFRKRKNVLNDITNRYLKESTPVTSEEQGAERPNENSIVDKRNAAAVERAESFRKMRNKINEKDQEITKDNTNTNGRYKRFLRCRESHKDNDHLLNISVNFCDVNTAASSSWTLSKLYYHNSS
ncbi:unnamed protein product [Callosobruchus maculatus]|uniref:Uncharacterized protein n=1 Tax=Callosobruchus maculatus TaxID=64391 RepID=A0A653BFA6_CALMS|nr:unnamed protein product [Callosobruchus maculatus]